MATYQQLLQYANNPNVRKMLDVIASAEGVKHGYNTIFGNERVNNLSAHPNVRKAFKQTDGRTNYTTAAGRYQFLNDTWNGLARRYGFKDFSPQNQDLGAIALIAGRGALNDVLKGNYQSAIQKLGSEWASLPSSPYAQNKRSQAEIDKFLGTSSQPQRLQAVSWKEISGQSAKTSRPELVRFDSLRQPERPKAVKFSEISGEQPQTDSRPALVAWGDIAGG